MARKTDSLADKGILMRTLVFAALVTVMFVANTARSADYALIEPTVQEIGTAYSVTPSAPWNKSLRFSGTEAWNKDGVGLGGLRFWYGIEDGQPLLKTKKNDQPLFRKDMTPAEIEELFARMKIIFSSTQVRPLEVQYGRYTVSYLSKTESKNIRTQTLGPAKFGNADGFRFGVSFTASSGVDMQGLVLVAVVDGRLQAIFYAAPKIHYYEAYLSEVEAIMSSVVLR